MQCCYLSHCSWHLLLTFDCISLYDFWILILSYEYGLVRWRRWRTVSLCERVDGLSQRGVFPPLLRHIHLPTEKHSNFYVYTMLSISNKCEWLAVKLLLKFVCLYFISNCIQLFMSSLMITWSSNMLTHQPSYQLDNRVYYCASF